MDVYRGADPCPSECLGGHGYVANARLAELRLAEWVLHVLDHHAYSVFMHRGRWEVRLWEDPDMVGRGWTLEAATESLLSRPLSLEVAPGETPVSFDVLNYLERCAEVLDFLEHDTKSLHCASSSPDRQWWEVYPEECYKDGPPFLCGEGRTLQRAVEAAVGWPHVPPVRGEEPIAREPFPLDGLLGSLPLWFAVVCLVLMALFG